MDRIMLAVAIGLALTFAVGVVLGVIVMISMASNREDRLGTLTSQPPDLLARGARRLYGVGLRDSHTARRHAARDRGPPAMSAVTEVILIIAVFLQCHDGVRGRDCRRVRPVRPPLRPRQLILPAARQRPERTEP